MVEPHAQTRDRMAHDLSRWYRAWSEHDLEGVLALMHDEVRFVHWDGSLVVGKAALRRAWSAWFAGRDFRFVEEETFLDETARKALFHWRLRWPGPQPGRRGEPEERLGVDVLHFREGLIIRKLSFCQTTVVIAGRRLPAIAQPPG
jgi:ketosteroid isomerase-like protein